MSSFTSDERGATEPYTDLPALGLVTAGILLFSYLIYSAYAAYAAQEYYVARLDDARTVATALIADPRLAADGTCGLLNASKLDKAAAAHAIFSGPPGSAVSAEVETADKIWKIGDRGKGRTVSYRLPLVVSLNDAKHVAGHITVTIAEGGT